MGTTPKTNEKHLQNNTIALLKAMGWQFITPEEMHAIKYLLTPLDWCYHDSRAFLQV
jgi:hypothetical protein